MEGIEEQARDFGYRDDDRENTFTVISDSQSAIHAIANPRSRSGQEIVHRILDRVQALRGRGVKVHLYWIPGHSGNAGNEQADQLAKQAVNEVTQHKFC